MSIALVDKITGDFCETQGQNLLQLKLTDEDLDW